MFYDQTMDGVFRFGDIVRGFPRSTPVLAGPLLDDCTAPYKIEVQSSCLSVILTPCCSIDKGTLSLAPLCQILRSFYQDPWHREDLTRVNRKMPAEKSVPPHAWRDMLQDVMERELDLERDSWAFEDFFVYEQHDLLPEYILNVRGGDNPRTRFYMVDFKTAYRIDCAEIKRNQHPVEAKVLQLSRETRAELREKIAAYFERTPAEDQL